MHIKDINQMSDDIFVDYFKNIFEKTPLLAKLVVWDADRNSAIQRMDLALSNFVTSTVSGFSIPNNLTPYIKTSSLDAGLSSEILYISPPLKLFKDLNKTLAISSV